MAQLLDLSLLKRNRDYRLLYGGQFISFTGIMITNVALPYQMYQETNSTMMVGLLSLVQLTPILITALLGGVFADRYNRKLMLLLSESLLALCCLGLTINAYYQTTNPSNLFILGCIMAAINGLHRPAFDSITQQIVKPTDYKSVGALASFKFSFCMIIGPAFAGLMIAHYGVTITYLINFLTFIISIINLLLMHTIPKPIEQVHPSILTALKQGVVYAFSKQELIGSYFVDFFAMVCAMPNALLPALAQNHSGAETLGLFYAAPALGALLISCFSGWTSKIKQDGKAIAISAAFWGGSIIGFGLAHSLVIQLFFLALSGVFDTISGIFRSTLWNHSIPSSLRGRLAGIEMISYLSGPKLGDTRAGVIASSFGMTAALVSGGIACLIGVGICCIALPKFWNYHAKT